MKEARYPALIVLNANKYTFATNDEDIYLPTQDVEEYTLQNSVSIPVHDSTGAGVWRGWALNIGENIFTLREWFRSGSCDLLMFDISQPIGSELCIYQKKRFVDNDKGKSPKVEAIDE